MISTDPLVAARALLLAIGSGDYILAIGLGVFQNREQSGSVLCRHQS